MKSEVFQNFSHDKHEAEYQVFLSWLSSELNLVIIKTNDLFQELLKYGVLNY